MCKIARYAFIGLFVVICLIACVFFADAIRAFRWKEKAKALKVGYSKEQVHGLMGDPLVAFPAGTMVMNRSNPETWIYGKQLSIRQALSPEPPYIHDPVVWRFFPSVEDTVVEFDEQGIATNVTTAAR
jgi:hypothetical protein